MAFASPTRSSPTLDRYLRHGSGSMGTHSPTYYVNRPTKPKKFQSAHYDEPTGTWRCRNCGYTYPNPEPHHHQRRAHKKICEGGLSKVHRWLTLSTGEEDSEDTSNVGEKPTTPETSDSATAQRSLGQKDENDGVRAPQLLDREFQFHEIPSSNELPKESEIEELGDPKGLLSDQSGLLASVENSEVQSKEEIDSEPVTEMDFKPRSRDLGRLLTLNSDMSLPSEPSLGRSDKVDFSAVASSEFVPVADDSTSGNKEERDIDMEEPLSRSSQIEAHSLKAGEDVLTADDALKERTEAAQGDHPTPSSDETGRNDQVAGDLGEAFDQREPSLIAADDNTEEKKAKVLQEVEESQMTPAEDGNAQEELNVETGEGSGETKAIFPAAIDDGALREKEEEVGSEQGIITITGDGTEYKSGDEHESSQFVLGVGDQEASQDATSPDQSGHLDHATEEVGALDGHDETEEVDAISSEPLSDDAEGVTGTSKRGPPVKLSSAERNWDDWEHVVSGEETSGENKMPPLPQEIEDAGPPFSEDGLTSSQSDNLEDNTADKSAPTSESKGGAVLMSDQDVGNEVGFQPAGLDWTLAFPDTVNNAVDKQQPVESLESSTSADYHSSQDQDRPELIPGLCQETDQTDKVASRLSVAEANWDDWEDVVKRGPILLKGITLGKTEDPESSGEYQTPEVGSLGDLRGLGQGTTGIVLESERVEGVIDTAAAAGLPVDIPESEKSDWLIDFSEPSVEDNSSGTANEEAVSPPAAVSSPKLEVPGTTYLDLLDLTEEGSGQEQEESLLDSIPVTQSETGQSSEVVSKLSSALRNWEDWDHVIRESERVSRPEEMSPVLESDQGGDEHQNGLESPRPADSNIVDSGSSEQAGLVEPLETPPVADNSNRAAMNSGQEIEDLSHGKRPDGMVTSVPEEADPLFRFPTGALESQVASNSLPENLDFLDSDLGPREGGQEVDSNKDSSLYESGQAGVDNLWEDDWEVVQKNEYPPAGSRHSSPSFEDAHDGELSSDHEFPNGLPTAVNLPLGKRRWADWEDLTRSEYMVLDGPDGESLVFKRTSGAREKLAAKSLGRGRESSPSLEEPDEDGGSPSLRRTRRQLPSFDDDISPSLKGASARGVVKSDYSAGSNSFQGFETTPKSLPASSPRKSESEDLAPLVTRRPLLYRGSRRDYTSEVEDMDVTSEPPFDQHLHHHNPHEHEDALKYDVEKVLRGQTTYELICPICGALITRKIIIRKKKRRFMTEGDPRWRRGTTEITPVDDDGNQSPRSDMSSEIEDVSGAWKQGIRPCFGYFFGS